MRGVLVTAVRRALAAAILITTLSFGLSQSRMQRFDTINLITGGHSAHFVRVWTPSWVLVAAGLVAAALLYKRWADR